jgi:hypothetical protein
VRLAFVLFHLAAITVAAMPSPIGMTRRSDWNTPEVRVELAAWTRRLASVGLDVEVEALEGALRPMLERWARAHRKTRRPFAPYYACCGTDQSWRLFVAPNRFPTWLGVDVHVDGRWQSVYREHSRSHTWMQPTLATDRMRALVHLYARPDRRADLERLARWFRDTAARDFPGATAVRIRHVRARLPTPAELRAGTRPPATTVSEVVRRIE